MMVFTFGSPANSCMMLCRGLRRTYIASGPHLTKRNRPRVCKGRKREFGLGTKRQVFTTSRAGGRSAMGADCSFRNASVLAHASGTPRVPTVAKLSWGHLENGSVVRAAHRGKSRVQVEESREYKPQRFDRTGMRRASLNLLDNGLALKPASILSGLAAGRNPDTSFVRYYPPARSG